MHEATHTGLSPKGDDARLAEKAERREARDPNKVIQRRLLESFAVTIAQHVPAGLAAITRACLAIEPDSRPGIDAVRRELEALGGSAADEPGISLLQEAAAEAGLVLTL